jgi:hypothetical protein
VSSASQSELLREELLRPPPAAARVLALEIRDRHPSLAAVVFYGSCLRKQTSEGVLDFYALVDDYRDAYASRPLARANAALPPNVFYVELPGAKVTLRTKYAVMTLEDFARAADGGLRSHVWARFCQPAQVVWARNEASRFAVVGACARALRTAVRRTLPLLPDRESVQHFDAATFWLALFRETYGAELRTESSDTIRSLFHAAPERYSSALRGALLEVAASGGLTATETGGGWSVCHPPGALRRARLARRLRRPVARVLSIAQLLKSALTFGDWLPYALWKLERHTGTHLVPTERQRRHPFLYGWPLILRVLRRGELSWQPGSGSAGVEATTARPAGADRVG